MDKQKAYQIIRHFADGVIPAKYKDMVKRWLVSDHDNETKDEALFQIWNETESDVTPQVHVSLDEFHRRRNNYMASMHRTFIMRKVMRYAAIILLPLIAVFAVWMYQFNAAEEMIACHVPYGMTKTLQLSDGTSVIINSGSTLSYPKTFKGGHRELSLLGEAHFAVAKDASHPFIVKVGTLNVQVLGTHFNVKAYSDDKDVITTLEEGSVKLYITNHDAQACILKPNEQAIYNKSNGSMKKEKVDAMNYSSWTTGALNFDNQSLNQIIPILERRYGVQFNVDSHLNMTKEFTMNFKPYETIDDVLTVLTQLYGDMSYQREGKVVKLIKGERDVGD